MKRILTIVLLGIVSAGTQAADVLSPYSSNNQRMGSTISTGGRRTVVNMPAGVGRIGSSPRTNVVERTESRADENPILLTQPVDRTGEKPMESEKTVDLLIERLLNESKVANQGNAPVTEEKVIEKPVVVEKQVVVERTNVVEKVVDRIVEKPVTVEKIVEKPVVVEKPVTVEKIIEKPVIVEKKVVVEKPVEVERIVVVERTNLVEKVVRDTAWETELIERERQLLERQKELQAEQTRLTENYQKLSDEKKGLEEKMERISGTNECLVGANAALGDQLAKERDRRQRLERVIPQKDRQFSDKKLKINAQSAFYDRKEGYVVFEGDVRVRDDQYILCAKKAFVFTDQTNSVKYVVALDNVAVTNGAKRAYGTKAAYYKKTGMVVLHGDAKTPAIVRDESRVEDQEVIGEKIKFWINSEQVEVLKARIVSPLQGQDDLKRGLLGR